MKKYALVMALALAASLAQADVTVYGKARLYEENTKTGTAEGVTSLTNDSSRFGIKASEALAGGMVSQSISRASAPNRSVPCDSPPSPSVKRLRCFDNVTAVFSGSLH